MREPLICLGLLQASPDPRPVLRSLRDVARISCLTDALANRVVIRGQVEGQTVREGVADLDVESLPLKGSAVQHARG